MPRKCAKYKFKQGDKVKIVGCASGTGLAIGTIATIQGPIGSGCYRLQEYPNWNIYTQDLEKVALTFDKKTLEKEKSDLQAQMDFIDSKMAFLDETGVDEGCEKEFRVYQTLTLFEDGNMTKKQKSAAIAKLLDAE